MINIKVSSKDNVIDKVEITGHAGYAQYGNDIVCSGVSTLVTTTINAILTFDKKYISYEQKKDKMSIYINVHNEIVDNLLKNMLNMLAEIEEDYPKNVKIGKENL